MNLTITFLQQMMILLCGVAPVISACSTVVAKENLCPDYGTGDWKCLEREMNCPSGLNYHCAKDENGRFVEGCASPEFCDEGQEPLLHPGESYVTCVQCRDPETYQPYEMWSNMYKFCLEEKRTCRSHFHEILCDDGDSKTDRSCRCDAKNNWVLEGFEYSDANACSTNNYVECVYSGPCPDGEERLRNYSCVPDCPYNHYRDPSMENCVKVNLPTPNTTSTVEIVTEYTSTSSRTNPTLISTYSPNRGDNNLHRDFGLVLGIIVFFGISGMVCLCRMHQGKGKYITGMMGLSSKKIYVVLCIASFTYFGGGCVALLFAYLLERHKNSEEGSRRTGQSREDSRQTRNLEDKYFMKILLFAALVFGGLGIILVFIFKIVKEKRKRDMQKRTDPAYLLERHKNSEEGSRRTGQSREDSRQTRNLEVVKEKRKRDMQKRTDPGLQDHPEAVPLTEDISRNEDSTTKSYFPEKMHSSIPTDVDIINVSKCIGAKKWEKLGHRLGLTVSVLEVIEKENSNSLENAIWKMLQRWREKNGQNATFYALGKALKDEEIYNKEVFQQVENRWKTENESESFESIECQVSDTAETETEL